MPETAERYEAERSGSPLAIDVADEHLAAFGDAGARTAESNARERVRVVRSRELPAFEVLEVTSSVRRWRGFHTLYEFCAVRNPLRRGEQRWSYRGRDYEAIGCSTLLLEPNETHRTTHVAVPATFMLVRTTLEGLVSFTEEMQTRPLHFRSGQLDDAEANAALTRAAHELVRNEVDPMAVETEFVAFLERAVACVGEEPLPRAPTACERAVAMAEEYVRAHFSERLTLGEVARIAGRTRWHLARSFRRLRGLTIHDYLTQVRLARAQDLLRDGATPTTAALDSGFADQAHLTRKLGGALGITPARYRAAR